MTSIPVEYNEFRNWPREVNVLVKKEGQIVWCNHVETDIEHDEEGQGYGLRFYPRTIEFCVKCNAWRPLGGEEWIRE